MKQITNWTELPRDWRDKWDYLFLGKDSTPLVDLYNAGQRDGGRGQLTELLKDWRHALKMGLGHVDEFKVRCRLVKWIDDNLNAALTTPAIPINKEIRDKVLLTGEWANEATPAEATSDGLKDGVPCDHPGCLSHRTHSCEGCGRIGGRTPTPAVALPKPTTEMSDSERLMMIERGINQALQLIIDMRKRLFKDPNG